MNIWDKTVYVRSIEVDTQLQYKLVDKDNGSSVVIDRGSRSDIYEGVFVCVGKTDEIYDIYQQVRRYSHIAVSNCNSDEALFGENVDYTNQIDCLVMELGDIVHTTNKIATVRMRVRAETPLVFSGTTTLPKLKCIGNGWSTETVLGQSIYDAYFGQQFIIDSLKDKYLCSLSATLKLSETISILNWFRLNRGKPFTMNYDDWGVQYPFGKGVDNGTMLDENFEYPFNARMLSLTVEYVSPTHRIIRVTLRKE